LRAVVPIINDNVRTPLCLKWLPVKHVGGPPTVEIQKQTHILFSCFEIYMLREQVIIIIMWAIREWKTS
jgi:hypothetical protein